MVTLEFRLYREIKSCPSGFDARPDDDDAARGVVARLAVVALETGVGGWKDGGGYIINH